jgi:hypothetical protein
VNSSGPLFLTLSTPYRAITSSTAACILKDPITQAGLAGQGLTPKSFRPSGAQAATDSKVDPKLAQQFGRWKTESVFYEHYVHSKPDKDFTSNILDM